MSAWLVNGRLSAVLATLTAIAAFGLWLIVLPLFAMGSVNEGPLNRILLALAFFGWPLAGALAIVAARTVRARPRKATLLLVFPAVALAFPFFLLPLLPVAAALLALRVTPGHRSFP
jgi:hypothetical protein